MENYYIIALNPNVNTFTLADAGSEVEFSIQTANSKTNSNIIKPNDKIIATVSESNTYGFTVLKVIGDQIILKKEFEIAKGINYPIESIGDFSLINNDIYNQICIELFSDYANIYNNNTLKSTSAIIQNSNLREFAFSVFKYINKEFGDDFLLSNIEYSLRTHGAINYEAILFTKYFGTNKLLGIFESAQNEDSLKTSGTLRFYPEDLKILNKNNIYFTTQWSFPEKTDSPTFHSLSLFIKDYSKSKYDIIYDEKENLYKLVQNENKTINQNPFLCKDFFEKIEFSKLKFSNKLITRFIASLCAKPFVICSGLSGSGKTKLAQSFVQWICEGKNQYAIIPIGADWTNREPLLGYPNGLKDESYITPDSGALNLIIEALKEENSKKPYFLILDEMNLSHVERYFADFLSIMESKDTIKLYTGAQRTNSQGEIINHQISWPKNLFIIGTVNIDETTYMFSPKVLDRANVIEFRISDRDMADYLSAPKDIDMDKFLANPKLGIGHGASMAEDFLKLSEKIDLKNNIDTKDTLVNFFIELQKAGAEFGYRSVSEINNLIALLDKLTEPNKKWDGEDITKEHDFIDIAIIQKLLPKLHGSRNKLIPILTTLAKFCVNNATVTFKDKDKEFRAEYFEKENNENIIYSLSFEKIKRMYHNAITNGFTSYAEA